MLSTEHLVDEHHLKNILGRINEPKTPDPNVKAGSKFRKSVVERIELKRIQSETDSFTSISEDDRSICVCFRCHMKDPDDPILEPEIIWRRMECKSVDLFQKYAEASISTSLNCIRCLKSIQQSLSFWEDPHPQFEGLSIIGSYMWLLSFSVQHLLDDFPKGSQLNSIEELRQIFQEIAQSGEIFSDLVEKFHAHSLRLRSDACYTVKKIVRKWSIEQNSPLIKRPEKPLYIIREPKRRIGKGLMDFQNEVELLEETALHLNWTPLTIMIRAKNSTKASDWKQFSRMGYNEKVHWFKVFAQTALDLMQSAAEEMTEVSGQISAIEIGNVGAESKSHARELSGALVHFAKGSSIPKKLTPMERSSMIRIISEYWFSVDILHEESHKLLRLIHETRDIIRTCYVYSDTFYKWNLPTYDSFLTTASNNNFHQHRKHSKGEQTIANIKSAFSRFIKREGTEKKLSDVSEMLVLMDFSTSAYQRILEMKPIFAENMQMKLEVHILDEAQENGLISGIDIRKNNYKK